MPLRLEIKRLLNARSDRVKAVDLHPTEPWVLAALFNGQIYIWNYNTQTLVKSLEVTDVPVRATKFIPRKNWIVSGSDDYFLRVYNYNTLERVKAWDAHQDYIRSVAVHDSKPYILSSSDDLSIKLWDWEHDFANTRVFEGHSGYVMMVSFSPKDPNLFATASLDQTVKVWGVNSSNPYFTLDQHGKGVNCVGYFGGNDKPYLISGSDDQSAKVWDYQTKACVRTLAGHEHNVSAVAFHPELPLIITGSEDGTVKIWNSNTYRLEHTLDYKLDRCWTLACLAGSTVMAFGYDNGCIVVRMGGDEPAVSMDRSGKIIWARNNDINSGAVKGLTEDDLVDGDKVLIPTKDLGDCEVFPTYLKHNRNGRFVTVCGDGEFIIYTALAWRNKAFGNGLDFVWSTEPNDYAVRESTSSIVIFKNFSKDVNIQPNFSADGLYGGTLICVKSSDFLVMYDWEGRVIRKIDVVPTNIFWNEAGDQVVIACDDSFYTLGFNQAVVDEAFATGQGIADDGVEGSFTDAVVVTDKVKNGAWIGECFVYVNDVNRLNYCVGGEIFTVAHLDRPMILLGFMASTSRVFLMDMQYSLVSYTLRLEVMEYEALVARQEFEQARELLPRIPKDQRGRIARFLETLGYKKEALEVSDDPEHQFDLAIQLDHLELAREIIEKSPTQLKWKQLGDMAAARNNLPLAEECLMKAQDFNSVMLLYSSLGNVEGMERLAKASLEASRHNVAFMAFFLLHDLDACIKVLVDTGRIAEAAFFARTYCPSRVSDVLALWKDDLGRVNEKAASALADPQEYPNLFPNFELALKAEAIARGEAFLPAHEHAGALERINRGMLEVAEAAGDDVPAPQAAHTINGTATADDTDGAILSSDGHVGDSAGEYQPVPEEEVEAAEDAEDKTATTPTHEEAAANDVSADATHAEDPVADESTAQPTDDDIAQLEQDLEGVEVDEDEQVQGEVGDDDEEDEDEDDDDAWGDDF